MEKIIEIFYIIGALVAISACFPQLRQLMNSKASDELSLSTWTTWMATQCITLMYVASIGNILMTIVNLVWVTFYAMMVVLIIKYRHIDKPTLVLSRDEQS